MRSGYRAHIARFGSHGDEPALPNRQACPAEESSGLHGGAVAYLHRVRHNFLGSLGRGLSARICQHPTCP